MSAGWNEDTVDLLTRFLLGELSDKERNQVEQRFLANNEFFDQLMAVESFLLDEHVQGRLSHEHRKRAQSLFQSSGPQRRDVDFTRELIALLREIHVEKEVVASAVRPKPLTPTDRYSLPEESPITRPKHQTSRTGFWRNLSGLSNVASRLGTITAFAALLLSMALVYLVFQLYSQRRDWQAKQAAMERGAQDMLEKLKAESQGRDELAKQMEIEKEKRARAEDLVAVLQSHGPGEVPSIVLAPTTFERGSNPKTIILKPNTARVRLHLELDSSQQYAEYDVLVTTFDGRKVWNKDSIGLKQVKRGRLSVTLPSHVLRYEDYRIEVKGLSSGNRIHVADYIFKVRK